MNISRLITGLFFILAGLVLVGISFFNLISLVWGIPSFGIGLAILLNNKEDYIEKRKDE